MKKLTFILFLFLYSTFHLFSQGNLFVKYSSGNSIVLKNWKINGGSTSIPYMQQYGSSSVTLNDYTINNSSTYIRLLIGQTNTTINFTEINKLKLIDYQGTDSPDLKYKFTIYWKSGITQEGWTSSYPFSGTIGYDVNHYNEKTNCYLTELENGARVLNTNEIIFNSDGTVTVSFQNKKVCSRMVFFSNLTKMTVQSIRLITSTEYYVTFIFNYKNSITKTLETGSIPFGSNGGIDISNNQNVSFSIKDVNYLIFDYITSSENTYFDTSSVFVFPNPFVDNFKVSYYFPYRTNVIMQLVNTEGKIIDELNDNLCEKGIVSFVLSEKIPTGIYYLIVKTNNSRVSRKLIKLD